MVALSPIDRALIAANSAAADKISAPNYDEFQSDDEIAAILEYYADSILGITMPHVGLPGETMFKEGSPEALKRAAHKMQLLRASHLTHEIENTLWLYEISKGARHQIGIGGYARTGEIRTENNPDGIILRNEEVVPEKVKGRKDLIEATGATIGVVNNAVKDIHGNLQRTLSAHAASFASHCDTSDEAGNTHRVWLVRGRVAEQFSDLLAEEPFAYVADGNHRSAAAADLKDKNFLSMFFPAASMRIAPYNRLVRTGSSPEETTTLLDRLQNSFTIIRRDEREFQPQETHHIGLFDGRHWHELVPKDSAFEQNDPVQVIDSDIVHRRIFEAALGITDTKDERLTFVGAKYDTQYLMKRVCSGEHQLAITLPPVTMEQFMDVCEAGLFMPPKSTWFDPKIRSGLVMALR